MADHNMNMPGMGGSSSAGMTTMRMTFTTSTGVPLWFDEWTPTTAGSTFGACVGLFFLAVLSRFVAVLMCSAEHAWDQHIALQQQSVALLSDQGTAAAPSAPPTDKDSQPPRPPAATLKRYVKQVPSFTPAVDVSRGICFMAYAFILYLLMLAVMTYSAWYLIAILIGLGVGETVFGRWARGFHDDGIHL